MSETHEWSPLQTAIFDAVAEGKRNVMVEAVAGSGKTSTIEETARRCGSTCSLLFLAFNRAIVNELEERIQVPFGKITTFHSLGYDVLKMHDGAKLHKGKMKELVKNMDYEIRRPVLQLVSHMKQYLWEPETDRGALQHIVDNFPWCDHTVEDEGKVVEQAVRVFRESLKMFVEKGAIDFDDMIYIPLVKNYFFPQYDKIFVDEVQDLNMPQREMVMRSCGPKTQVVAVGDSKQAIYAFRGADADSLAQMVTEFDMIRLPLSITYRCPFSVVLDARIFAPQITARAGAPRGSVTQLDKHSIDWGAMTVNDMVLCRFNAPLFEVAMRLIRKRTPFTISSNLEMILKKKMEKICGKNEWMSIPDFLKKMKEAKEEEIIKAEQKKRRNTLGAIHDRYDAIEALCEGASDVGEAMLNLEKIFDGKRGVKLSTIHKAKGLEADNVYFLGRAELPCKWAKTPEAIQQEKNLIYVGITRAKRQLIYVD